MILSFSADLRIAESKAGDDNPTRTLLRSFGGFIAEDGVNVTPDAKGVSTVKLTPTQTAAFRDLWGNEATPSDAFIAAFTAGSIALPDGNRGRQTVVGASLADMIAHKAAADAAAAEAIAAEAAESNAEAVSTDEASTDTTTDAPAPVKRSRKSATV